MKKSNKFYQSNKNTIFAKLNLLTPLKRRCVRSIFVLSCSWRSDWSFSEFYQCTHFRPIRAPELDYILLAVFPCHYIVCDFVLALQRLVYKGCKRGRGGPVSVVLSNIYYSVQRALLFREATCCRAPLPCSSRADIYYARPSLLLLLYIRWRAAPSPIYIFTSDIMSINVGNIPKLCHFIDKLQFGYENSSLISNVILTYHSIKQIERMRYREEIRLDTECPKSYHKS